MNSMHPDLKARGIVLEDCHKVTEQVICDPNGIGTRLYHRTKHQKLESQAAIVCKSEMKGVVALGKGGL